MRVLILEDSPGRTNYFRKWLADTDLTVVDSVADAVLRASRFDYDAIFLDHELGIGQPNGSQFTRAWRADAETWVTKQPLVVLHTSSDWGASLMYRDLQEIGIRAERMAFYLMDEDKVRKTLGL
ncbi:MAG: hypothetical protein RIS47_2254 [Bacteroidota bacterium]